MTPQQFVETIYLGDRSITSITLDVRTNEVKIQIDCISRVRGESWNFYSAEDLERGSIVLEGIQSFEITPRGALPNDYITNFQAVALNSGMQEFRLDASSTDESGKYFPVSIVVRARSVALEKRGDTANRIRE